MSLHDEFLSLVSVESYDSVYKTDILEDTYFGESLLSIVNAEKGLLDSSRKSIAYFSMEYGLAPSIYHTFKSSRPISDDNMFCHHNVFSNLRAMDYFAKLKIDKMLDMPIYSGGLGVLAGDTLKSAADMKQPLVGLGILWKKGYFKQNFWFKYGQVPEEMHWDLTTYPGLIPLKNKVSIPFREHTIHLRLWKYYVYSYDMSHVIPLVLLDANILENEETLMKLTDKLYQSDSSWIRIMQRALLGIGGVKALEELGYSIDVHHLNEGHAAFAFLEKVLHASKDEQKQMMKHFAYTCHTPVAAGHDRFGMKDISSVFTDEYIDLIKEYALDPQYENVVNLTVLALNTSDKVNAVSKKHGEVTRLQFPSYKEKIQSITNGIHTFTWLSEPMEKVFDKYKDTIGEWKQNPCLLSNVALLKNNNEFREDVWNAHQENKRNLMTFLGRWKLKEDVFTFSWARRIASYKRPSLFMQDVQRLLDIAKRIGEIQIVFAGKAHPADNLGFTYIKEMMNKVDSLSEQRNLIRIIMLENYDTYFGKLLTNSVDVWLNNPLPPFEASGTSGMKAILNGVVQMTTFDGWVIEAAEKNIGPIFGYQADSEEIGQESDLRMEEDSKALYDTLEVLAKQYYETNQDGKVNLESQWIDMMINCIEQSAYFSTQRMVDEYRHKIWT